MNPRRSSALKVVVRTGLTFVLLALVTFFGRQMPHLTPRPTTSHPYPVSTLESLLSFPPILISSP